MPCMPETKETSNLEKSFNPYQVPQSMVDAARVCMTRYQQGPTKARQFQGDPGDTLHESMLLASAGCRTLHDTHKSRLEPILGNS